MSAVGALATSSSAIADWSWTSGVSVRRPDHPRCTIRSSARNSLDEGSGSNAAATPQVCAWRLILSRSALWRRASETSWVSTCEPTPAESPFPQFRAQHS